MAPVIFWRWIWLAIGAAFIFSMFLYVEKMNRNATFEQIEKTITFTASIRDNSFTNVSYSLENTTKDLEKRLLNHE